MSIISLPGGSSNHRDTLTSSWSASYAGVIAFIAVANEGSFSRAADRLGVGRSAVSRSVRKLEGQLETRLFLRTTRSTTITREGELFYENCLPGVGRILQALEEMRDLREGPPQGQLKISATTGFGRKVVAPLLAEFRALFPAVALELVLEERIIDLASDRIDVAFREGRLEDSDVIAKQLIPMRLQLCASPDYARRCGLPESVDDLPDHACINQRLATGRLQCWEFKVNGHAYSTTPNAGIVVNDPEVAMRAVLDGQGLAQLPAYQVSEALRSGALTSCLAHLVPDDRGHYLCYLSRQHLPKRIRVFIDFMTTRIRALDLDYPILAQGTRRQSAPMLVPATQAGVAA